MNSRLFEVGLFKPTDPGGVKTSPEMILRSWDADTLLRSTPWLKLENMGGRNIYIRPSGEHHFSLVDDVTASNIERMKSSGFQPAVVVETSPGNFQAWLNHGQRLPRDFGTTVARALAQKFEGDTKAADWRHFGRLAGFTNQKEKHRQATGLFPYVGLIDASGIIYPQAETFLSDVQKRFETEQQNRRDRMAASVGTKGVTDRFKSIEEFRRNPAYGGDGTRVDLAFALYAAGRGLSEGQIRSALRSRDLSHKGSERRQEDYLDRTIRKAFNLREPSRCR